MFRSISSSFEKKKKNINSIVEKDKGIKQSLRDFLQKEFGDDLKGFSLSLSFDPKENSLSIKADNKIIANELSLKLAELNSYLNRRGIKLSRIIIR